MKKILVTGGAGYIGSHTVDVIIVDNFSNSNQVILNKLHKLCVNESGKFPIFYDRDCRDGLGDILLNHEVDGVIHFAALKAVGESVEKPLEYYNNNITHY